MNRIGAGPRQRGGASGEVGGVNTGKAVHGTVHKTVQRKAASGAGAGRLVAVVVTHDRQAQLRRTVTRLLETAPEHLSALVVVDNASSDGTADWLARQDDPRLQVLCEPRNRGGAGGFEAGMRYAMALCAPDWIVVMDDDARPEPGALAAFHAAAGDTGAEAIAAAVRYPDGRICEMNRPSRNPFWRPAVFWRTLRGLVSGGVRDGYHIPRSAYGAEGRPRPVDMASFVGLFLSREAVAAAGYPRGGLFLYGDDVIYCLTLRRAGGRLAFDPRVRFEHDCSTFADDRRRVFRPLWKVYYTYRNGLIMYRTAAGPLFWLMVPLLVPKWLWTARRYGAERAAYLRLTRRAVSDGLRGRTDLGHEAVRALSER